MASEKAKYFTVGVVLIVLLMGGAIVWMAAEKTSQSSMAPADGPATVAAASVPASNPAAGSGAGVIELVVAGSGDINLDAGTVASAFEAEALPAGVSPAQATQPEGSPEVRQWMARRAQARARWRAAHGVSFTVEFTTGYTVQTDAEHHEIGPRTEVPLWGLAYYNRTLLVQAGDELWENPSREAIESVLGEHGRLAAATGFRNSMQTAIDETVRTYAFRTAEGTVGVLRFVSFNSKPKPEVTIQIRKMPAGR